MIITQQESESTMASSDSGEKMRRSKSFFSRVMSVRTVTMLQSSELSTAAGFDDSNRKRFHFQRPGSHSHSHSSSAGSSRKSSRWSSQSLHSSAGSLGLSFRKKTKEGVKKLDREDVEVGKLLGKGGFNHVYEVTNVRRPSLLGAMGGGKVAVDHSDQETSPPSPSAPRRSSCSNYVVKHLSPSCFADEEKFRAAAVDLALEAKLLSKIDHPNVIKLHGVTKGSVVSAFSSDDDAGYFLLLDKLECTLVERSEEWREERRVIAKRRRSSLLDNLFSSGKAQRRSLRASLLCVRLKAALQIAQGMSYLHGRRIIYRDIKPGNIGFDASGTVKIFDFGLSRELPAVGTKNGGRMTGIAGTPRYMAPEIAQCKPYGLSADVYSFGLLLWEICALQRPFSKYSQRDLQEKVVYGTKRPKMSSKWSESLRDLIGQCWHVNPEVRPEFRDVADSLQKEVTAVDTDTMMEDESLH